MFEITFLLLSSYFSISSPQSRVHDSKCTFDQREGERDRKRKKQREREREIKKRGRKRGGERGESHRHFVSYE